MDGVQVDPEVGSNDTGNFLFLKFDTLWKLGSRSTERAEENEQREDAEGAT